MAHIPVLLHEVMQALNPKPGEFIIDGTLGGGGHAKEIVGRITPGGTLLAVDRDPRAVRAFTAGYQAPATVKVFAESASYARLPQLLAQHGLAKADGLLLDLGFSSEQLAGGSLAGRGFSFAADEPLLMTYDDETPSVAELLAGFSEADLASIIREYGEERYAAEIAKAVLRAAKKEGIATTGQLVAAIRTAVPPGYEHGRMHPATRTFQALRIYANKELQQLETLLTELPKIVKSGGRVAIISFHSLEDRIVKNYFRQYARLESAARQTRDRGGRSVGRSRSGGPPSAGELPNSTPASTAERPLPGSKKPIIASEQEIAENPRSRSAKLRVLAMP